MCVTVAMKLPRDKNTGKPTKDAKWRLAKIRDRAYDPTYKVKRYTVNDIGASQLFLVDNDSDWTEGISIHPDKSYLSIVNSALNNKADKKDGSKKKSGNSNTVISDNGKIIRNALKSHDIEQAVEIIKNGNLDGCNLITDGDRLFIVEITLPAEVKNKHREEKERTGKRFDQLVTNDDYEVQVKEIKKDYLIVRTNHGVLDDEFGYQPENGDSYLSSQSRRKHTIEALESNVFEPLDLIVTLSKLGREEIDKNPFFRPLRVKGSVKLKKDDVEIYSTTIVQMDPSGTMIVKPIECKFDINNYSNLISAKYLTHMVILPHRSRMFESFRWHIEKNNIISRLI